MRTFNRFAGACFAMCQTIFAPCSYWAFPYSSAGNSRKRNGSSSVRLASSRGSADAHSHLGFALLKLNRHDEARACCEKAIALKPDVPTAHSTLGNALLRLQLDEQAVAAFTRAIQLNPNDVEVVLQSWRRGDEA